VRELVFLLDKVNGNEKNETLNVKRCKARAKLAILHPQGLACRFRHQQVPRVRDYFLCFFLTCMLVEQRVTTMRFDQQFHIRRIRRVGGS
jgi:hypothetical protein